MGLFVRTFYCLVFLFVSLTSISFASECDALLLLTSNPLIRSPHVDEYLVQFFENKPIDENLIQSLDWKWKTKEQLNDLAKSFENFIPADKKHFQIQLQLDVREYVHRKHGRGLFLIGIFYLKETGAPVAFFGKSFRKNETTGTIEVWGDGLRIDHSSPATKDLIYPLLKYLDSIYKQQGVGLERLVADWRGRFYWTMANYRLDPDYLFYEGTVLKDQLTVIKNNFLRFLKKHNIELTDLTIDRKTGKVKVQSIDDFLIPRDFIQAKHVNKLQLQTLIDVDTIEKQSQPLDVGVAFALADYTPEPLDALRILSNSKQMEYNDTAMPAWRAIRSEF